MYNETDRSQKMKIQKEKTARGEGTRRRIVEQSAAVFNRHGYAGTSMSELMAATGLEKGGLYRHFESKEELAAAAFDYAWETVNEPRQEGNRTLHHRDRKALAAGEEFCRATTAHSARRLPGAQHCDR